MSELIMLSSSYKNLLNFNLSFIEKTPPQSSQKQVAIEPTTCFIGEYDDPSRFILDQAFEIWKILYEQGVIVPAKAEVLEYIAAYPDVLLAVVNASLLARNEFGISAQLSLELYEDPEIDDVHLSLIVRQETYSADIMDKIDKVCAAYEPYIQAFGGWFIFTTDFRKPI
jgi:hypothetical protein